MLRWSNFVRECEYRLSMVLRSSFKDAEAGQIVKDFNYDDSVHTHLQRLLTACTRGNDAPSYLWTNAYHLELILACKKSTKVCFISFRQSQGPSCHWICHCMRCAFTRNIHSTFVQSSVVQIQEQCGQQGTAKKRPADPCARHNGTRFPNDAPTTATSSSHEIRQLSVWR